VRLLQTARSGNILSGGGSQALDTVVADAQGAYAFSFSASEDYQYELQGFAPGYLKGAFDSQPTVAITGGRKNRKTVPIRPEGYLRVRLLAPSPAPRAGVQLENYNGSYAYVFAGLDGRPVVPIDTSLIITYPGGQPNTFAWRVYLDSFGTSTAHSQTQFFPARDTADFTITF
jgi:hypothetical protein